MLRVMVPVVPSKMLGEGKTAAGWNTKLEDHTFNHECEAERVNWKWGKGYQTSKPTLSDTHLPAKLHLPTASPDNASKWGPRT